MRTLTRLVAVVALATTVAVPMRAVAASDTLRLGSVTLHPCRLGVARPTWCGTLNVPLDYTDARAGTIEVGFGWLPAAHPTGTVLAQEGGPGYPSTGTAPDFARLVGTHRNLLVVDARGTGRSTPIDCEPLQSLPSPSARFTAAVTACGRSLNHTWRRAGGGWVHASDLFTTANTARDVALVLGSLRVGKIDLYGDSYGTFFAQSFLARYPGLLRSVVLDSAYEARDLDPWYLTSVRTARAAFDHVCTASVGCPAGSSWARIGDLATKLRAHPVVTRAVGTDARLHPVRLDVTALVNIVNDAGYDTDPYRQLDAAARALLQHHDATPLARLYLQDIGYDYSDYSAKASYYSDGLYMAVACTDYPQLFSMHAGTAERRRQLTAAVAAYPASAFAPFTVREWLRVLPYTETYTGCLTWPKPTHPADPPIPPGPLSAHGVPVLVLNGSLDSLTPAAGGAHVARQFGPTAHAYVAANTVHLVALTSPYACGGRVVRAFLRHPEAWLDTRCLSTIAPIRAVPAYATSLAQVPAAYGTTSPGTRRLAAVALSVAGDATYRYDYIDADSDRGLRGGTVTYGAHERVTFTGVRWTRDTRVDGTLAPTSTGWAGLLTVRHATTTLPCRVRWGSGRTALMRCGGSLMSAPAP